MHILKWCMSIFFFCRLVELGKVWNNKCSGEIQVKCRSTGEGSHHRWRDASPGPQFSLLLGVIGQCGTPDCLLLCCHQANPGLPRLSALGSFLHWSAHGSLRQQALRAPADVPRAQWGGSTVPDGALWQVSQVSLTLDQLQTGADCSQPRDSQGAP